MAVPALEQAPGRSCARGPVERRHSSDERRDEAQAGNAEARAAAPRLPFASRLAAARRPLCRPRNRLREDTRAEREFPPFKAPLFISMYFHSALHDHHAAVNGQTAAEMRRIGDRMHLIEVAIRC